MNPFASAKGLLLLILVQTLAASALGNTPIEAVEDILH